MKKLLIFCALFLSTSANAWWGGGGYGPGFGPGFGYGYGGYGYGMGYMYPPLQVPSFNYQTTIVQQPAPIIVQERPEVIYREAPPKVIYKDRYCDKRCFEQQYSK